MRAWELSSPRPIDQHPLRLADRPDPEPGPGQVGITVHACGVCRTDLHIAEGDLPPRQPHVVPGHQVVGRVETLGTGATRFTVGERVGVAWLASTCGTCRFCRRGQENLCAQATFTGWDHDGGYAQAVVAHEGYIYRLPSAFSDEEAAPLLCAGIIGYRALKLCALPPGGRLGIYGFGGSAHLTAQLALHQGAELHVMTRSARARELATSLGAAWVGDVVAAPPHLLDAAILFAPAGELVPVALSRLGPGGVLVIAGISLSEIPPLSYDAHLFKERSLLSVTANTRADGEEFLRLAARLGVRATVTPYPLESAPTALADLAHGRVSGVAVLVV